MRYTRGTLLVERTKYQERRETHLGAGSGLKNNNTNMISICCPTRGRPELFKKMCLSVLNTASEPNDIEIISYHDNDDTSQYEYIGNHKEIVGERIVLSQMWNECQKIATGEIYGFVADDLLFKTKGWDIRVKETFDASKDKNMLVYPNDEKYGINNSIVGFLHKNWIEAVGYFLPPYFSAEYIDGWIFNVAKRINRRVFLNDVIVIHSSFESGKEPMDETHREYLMRKKRDSVKRLYYSKGEEREKNARCLLEFINNFV